MKSKISILLGFLFICVIYIQRDIICNSADRDNYLRHDSIQKSNCRNLIKPISFRGRVTAKKHPPKGNRIEMDVFLLLDDSTASNNFSNDSCSYFHLEGNRLMLRIAHTICSTHPRIIYESDILQKDSNSIMIKVYDGEGKYEYSFDFLSE